MKYILVLFCAVLLPSCDGKYQKLKIEHEALQLKYASSQASLEDALRTVGETKNAFAKITDTLNSDQKDLQVIRTSILDLARLYPDPSDLSAYGKEVIDQTKISYPVNCRGNFICFEETLKLRQTASKRFNLMLKLAQVQLAYNDCVTKNRAAILQYLNTGVYPTEYCEVSSKLETIAKN